MKGPFSALAGSMLRGTTTAAGQSTLPGWLVTPLSILAGYDVAGANNKDAGWADEKMVRKAIALYRAANSRGGQTAVNWQFSTDGRQAVQVLPAPANSVQQQAFVELSRRLESVTMNHPRLAPILEAATQQGYPFLAARIGDGFQSLTRRFGLPLEPEQAMRVAEQVTSALEYAHYRGVIHGAFDLHDVLVNEQGQASLLGVGVEQLRQRLGATGVTVLSPLMPPEVESGAQPADMRTDVFAMGALVYILLTGRVPAAGQQIQLSHSIPSVPAAVDGVLTKALAVNPDERYPSLLGVGVEQLRQRLGATGVTVLSPLMPPEVESGAQPADMRTDVFAMGALVYILLTGRVPAAGQKIQLSHSIPSVPAAVDGVLTKALAVNPDERYPSLLEMNRDLRVALRAPRAVTRPSTPTARRVEAAQARRSPSSPSASRSAPQPTRPPATNPDGFPEQLPMPDIDFSSLNQALEMPAVEAWVKIEIPPAPEIPKVDWAELLHLVDVSAYSSEIISLPYAAAETLAPDPMVAAAMAVKATEQTQQSRQRAARQPAETASRPQSAPPPAKPQPPAKPRRVRRP